MGTSIQWGLQLGRCIPIMDSKCLLCPTQQIRFSGLGGLRGVGGGVRLGGRRCVRGGGVREGVGGGHGWGVGVGWGGGGDGGRGKGGVRVLGFFSAPREEPALESLNAAVHLHLCAQRGRRPEFLLAWKFTRGIGVICRGKWGLS